MFSVGRERVHLERMGQDVALFRGRHLFRSECERARCCFEAQPLLEETRYASLYNLRKCMTSKRSCSKLFKHRIVDMNKFVNFTGKHYNGSFCMKELQA